jgi:hypothetical protein
MDAQKINDIPVIKDVEHKKPNFDYSIFSQPVFSTFSVTNLQAATIMGKPKEEVGFGLLRLGPATTTNPTVSSFSITRMPKTPSSDCI